MACYCDVREQGRRQRAKSIGITVASGMLASTCIAVVFVPSFFVVLQRLSERRGRRAAAKPVTTAPGMPKAD